MGQRVAAQVIAVGTEIMLLFVGKNVFTRRCAAACFMDTVMKDCSV